MRCWRGCAAGACRRGEVLQVEAAAAGAPANAASEARELRASRDFISVASTVKRSAAFVRSTRFRAIAPQPSGSCKHIAAPPRHPETMLWSMIAGALIAATLWLGVRPVWRWRLRKLPGPRAPPFVGHLPSIARLGFHRFSEQISQRYGAVAVAWFGSRPVVLVADAEMAHRVCMRFLHRQGFEAPAVLTEEDQKVRLPIGARCPQGPCPRSPSEPIGKYCRPLCSWTAAASCSPRARSGG